MGNVRSIVTWALVAAVGILAVGILALLVFRDNDEADVPQDSTVTLHAQQEAFDDPVVAMVPPDGPPGTWEWLYDPASETCTGTQMVVAQDSEAPIRVTGSGNIAIGSIGAAAVHAPAGAQVYTRMSLQLGHSAPLRLTYLPADPPVDGATTASFHGGIYARAKGDVIAARQEATAVVDVVGVTATECYGSISADWSTPPAVAIAAAFDTVAHVTPVPTLAPDGGRGGRDVNTPTPTATPPPGLVLVHTDLDEGPSSDTGSLLQPSFSAQERTGYVVAEMYQDVGVGQYDADGFLPAAAWRRGAGDACEVDLALAFQEGVTRRVLQTPWPTWTPVPPDPTPTTIVITAALPAQFSSTGAQLQPDRSYIATVEPIMTPTPAPTRVADAPLPIPPPEPVEKWRSCSRIWSVCQRQAAQGENIDAAYINYSSLSVTPTTARQDGTDDAPAEAQATANLRTEIYFKNVDVFGADALQPRFWIDQPADTNKYATVGTTCDGTVDIATSFATAAPASTGASTLWTKTATLTICANNGNRTDHRVPDTGLLVRFATNLLVQSDSDWVEPRHVRGTAYAYMQINRPDAPGVNTNEGDQNTTTGGENDRMMMMDPSQWVQPPQPTPYYEHSATWRGWEGRPLSIILDGAAELNAPSSANVYSWARVILNGEPAINADGKVIAPASLTLARLPVHWQNGILHLASGSARVLLPSHAFEIDASLRTLQLHVRVAPIPDCDGLRLRWARPAGAVVSALTEQPYRDWVPEPTATPGPTATPTRPRPTVTTTPTPWPTPENTPTPIPDATPTPVPQPAHPYYMVLVDAANLGGNANELRDRLGNRLHNIVRNCDDHASVCWHSSDGSVTVSRATTPSGGYYVAFVGEWQQVASIRQEGNPFELRSAFEQYTRRWQTDEAAHSYLLSSLKWTAEGAALEGKWIAKEVLD